MKALIKAEFRKIFTARATYGILIFTFVLLGIFAFYVDGIKAGDSVNDTFKMANETTQAILAMTTILSVVGLLLVTNEYRYNTIAYTLTSSKSRVQTFFAKLIAVSCFAMAAIFIVGALSPLLANLGLHLNGQTLVPQNYFYKDLLWRSLFYGWGFGMIGYLLAVIIRSQVGAIVTLFLAPATVEPLLGLVLKSKAVYLPFSALNNVLVNGTISHTKAAFAFLVSFVIGLAIALFLFIKRDAN